MLQNFRHSARKIETGLRPRRGVLGAAFASLMVVFTHVAMAQTNLVTNGTFAITGGSQSFQFGTYNGYTPSGSAAGESLAGWASTSYGFVFKPTSTVATGTYGNLSLYSTTTTPSSTFNNASPTGGNFIGEDSAFNTSAITQTINGLTVGKSYALSFYWAGAQQTGFSGATTEQWQVSLGASTLSTAVINVASQGFSGWMLQTMNFVAASASSQLSFLAIGTPNGVPPFALLSNVSLVAAPEPASAALMFVGVAALVGFSWRQRATARSGTAT